ncbi:Crp/Fnr family transcriptional regulator [Saccharibacillus sacchari]|uniref:Cyclic nucleotide-binding domain-containing protein n=1 Tax=Saccharibacillus sacchari TaxID=456493 RepID=A0ACC6P945_9BACL
MRIDDDPERIRAYMSEHSLESMFTDPSNLDFQLREYEKGETVMAEGDRIDGLYIQVEGQARVSSNVETGKSLVLRFCHPVSLFGDLEIVRRLDVQSDVKAVQDCVFLFISTSSVERDLMRDERFLNELLRHMAYKLHTCTIASRVNLLASVDERLATYLISTRAQGGFGKELHSTQTAEIASVIGTTQRHLNRVIQKFADRNLLRREEEGFVVTDWERLDEISQGIRY